MIELGLAIDGGKDSLSMAAVAPGPDGGADETVKSPGTLVVSAYAACPDIRLTITPDLKRQDSDLLLVDLGGGNRRLGGSALAHVFGQVGEQSPDISDTRTLRSAFEVTQDLIQDRQVLSGHDRSDGGVLTALLEMAFAGNRGIDIQIDAPRDAIFKMLFNEELGLLLETASGTTNSVIKRYADADVPCVRIGNTTESRTIRVVNGSEVLLEDTIEDLRDLWEETSYQLDRLQANPDCVDQERETNRSRTAPAYRLSFTPKQTPPSLTGGTVKPKVAVLREEGSNGDREMASAFHLAGFEPWDVSTSDIASGEITLDAFSGVAFVGGFSFADVMDSAKGWAGVIRFNARVLEEMRKFHARQDTFSLGVCNGCQLMALLGWVPGEELPDTSQPRFVHNTSGRFESRFSTVRIGKSPAVMLNGMHDSVLGVWVAHGEGRAYFPDESVRRSVEKRNLIALRYADDTGHATDTYPHNPNGSPGGIAGLCSQDGRHLAMMPHPERAFLKWQWGWMPADWDRLKASPWLRMFQNARTWGDQT